MQLKDLYKHRSVWMGLAMLWVVLFHAAPVTNIKLLDMFSASGYGGVDIFMFASGLGAYYSYTRDHSPLDFIRRRVKRLYPVYLPFIIIWAIGKILFGGGYKGKLS